MVLPYLYFWVSFCSDFKTIVWINRLHSSLITKHCEKIVSFLWQFCYCAILVINLMKWPEHTSKYNVEKWILSCLLNCWSSPFATYTLRKIQSLSSSFIIYTHVFSRILPFTFFKLFPGYDICFHLLKCFITYTCYCLHNSNLILPDIQLLSITIYKIILMFVNLHYYKIVQRNINYFSKLQLSYHANIFY